jgi:hypothetical protein
MARLLPVLVAVAFVLPASVAQAHAPHAHALCVPVRATGAGQDLGGGRTQATISVHGVQVGTTQATFAIGGVTGTVAPFTGPIVFTSALGTLTAQVAGTFDVASGAFHATSTGLSGTGLLRRVTGQVTLDGQENLASGTFTETITGRLCAG